MRFLGSCVCSSDVLNVRPPFFLFSFFFLFGWGFWGVGGGVAGEGVCVRVSVCVCVSVRVCICEDRRCALVTPSTRCCNPAD